MLVFGAETRAGARTDAGAWIGTESVAGALTGAGAETGTESVAGALYYAVALLSPIVVVLVLLYDVGTLYSNTVILFTLSLVYGLLVRSFVSLLRGVFDCTQPIENCLLLFLIYIFLIKNVLITALFKGKL